MSYHDDLATIIRTYVSTISIISAGTVAVQYDNQKFKPPEGKYWVRVSIREGESGAATLGATVDRTVGVVFFQLFAPLDRGDGTIREYADTIKTAMRAVDLSGVWFRIPNVETVGRRGSWWQVNVTCPFTVDNTP